ncbi:hypothetical protein SRHO_G00267820 [Serrasalmus rhombeus]
MALELVLAKKGGVCKLLGNSCSFFVLDYHDNIKDIIKHMKDTIHELPEVDPSWLGTMCFELPDLVVTKAVTLKMVQYQSVKAEIEDYNPYDDQPDLYPLPDWMEESDEHVSFTV